jgi:hypothetical protein
MQAVKFLERPKVIRFFGICLLLAPFINIGFNILLQSQKTQVTTMILWKSLMLGTFAQNMQNLLSLGSIAIGAVMMFGQRKAWSFVLGLIGLHIIIQTTTLMKDIKENWVWGIVFLINLAVFFFIADQLVFKEKRDEAEPENTPAEEELAKESLEVAVDRLAKIEPVPAPQDSYQGLVTKKRIIIHFSDLNLWAQLMHISNQGLWVKALESKSIDVIKKPMVVMLRQDLPLKLMLDHVKGEQCFFQFFPMSAAEVAALNQWILEKAEVKRASSEGDFNSLSFTQKVS